MKKLPFILLGVLNLWFYQSVFAQCNLKVIVTELHSEDGVVKLEIRTHQDIVFKDIDLSIDQKGSQIVFESIPKGVYFIKYFHDANKNNKLDKNFVGIPQEGYGFSNNPDAKYGPPENEKMFFKVNTDTTILLKTYYW